MVDPINRVPLSTGTTHAPEQSQRSAVESTGKPRETAGSEHEQVALSNKAQLAHEVSNAAQRSAGVDGERIQTIREALANNNYAVSPTAISKAVVHSAWLLRNF